MARTNHRSAPSTPRGRPPVALLALAYTLAAGAPACQPLLRPVVREHVAPVRTECLTCARLDATWVQLIAGSPDRASEVLAELRWQTEPGSAHQLLAQDLHLLSHAVICVGANRLDVAEQSVARMGSPALRALRRRLLTALNSRSSRDLVEGLVQGHCAPSRLEVCKPFAWPPLAWKKPRERSRDGLHGASGSP